MRKHNSERQRRSQASSTYWGSLAKRFQQQARPGTNQEPATQSQCSSCEGRAMDLSHHSSPPRVQNKLRLEASQDLNSHSGMAMNCCAKHHLTLNVFSKVAASDLKSYGHGICSFWYLGIAPSSFSLVSSICFPLQHTSSPFTSDQLMTTAFPLTPQKLDSTILNNRTLILLMNTLSLGEGTCLKVTAIKQELGCQSGNSDS